MINWGFWPFYRTKGPDILLMVAFCILGTSLKMISMLVCLVWTTLVDNGTSPHSSVYISCWLQYSQYIATPICRGQSFRPSRRRSWQRLWWPSPAPQGTSSTGSPCLVLPGQNAMRWPYLVWIMITFARDLGPLVLQKMIMSDNILAIEISMETRGIWLVLTMKFVYSRFIVFSNSLQGGGL